MDERISNIYLLQGGKVQMTTSREKENMLLTVTDHERLKVLLAKVKEQKVKIQEVEKAYYDEEKDKQIIDQYYREIDFDNSSGMNLFRP